MSSARRASNPDCHNRERVLSPRGVQRSNQLSYGTGKAQVILLFSQVILLNPISLRFLNVILCHNLLKVY